MSTPKMTTADLARAKEPAAPERVGSHVDDAPVPYEAPVVRETTPAAAADQATAPRDEAASPLFARDAADELQHRWDSIQAGFVDEPRRAVEDADELVADAMRRLAETFAQERSRLEQQWDRGDNVSTEDFRVTLQRYRSFFKRLLSV